MGTPFLDLGRMPLANSFLNPDCAELPEEKFPLAVVFCEDCCLVQVTDLVPPEKLFSEYMYFSSYSDVFLRHASTMADFLIGQLALGPSSRVLEVASNDGYLLHFFQQRGIPVLGVEPARNIAAAAMQRGIPTLNRFFSEDAVVEVVDAFGHSDLIVGINVLAHVPDVNGFLRAVRQCLAPAGTAMFEFAYLAFAAGQDSVRHDLSRARVLLFACSAIRNLVARAGLELWDVIRSGVSLPSLSPGSGGCRRAGVPRSAHRSGRLLHMATRPVLIVPRTDAQAEPVQASAVTATAGADQG